tara:strand:+ start:445 stop:696 length:252 start_codon:yes stop_codon:yes gene_type:complete
MPTKKAKLSIGEANVILALERKTNLKQVMRLNGTKPDIGRKKDVNCAALNKHHLHKWMYIMWMETEQTYLLITSKQFVQTVSD